MAGEWKRTTIGEQATLQRGIDITKAQQRPGKIPVVSSAGISSCHDTFHAKGPGVILGRKGNAWNSLLRRRGLLAARYNLMGS